MISRSSPSSLNSVPGVLRVQDLVARLEVHLLALAVVEDATRADGQDHPLLGLLLRGVRDHDAALRRLLARRGLDDDAVAERAELLRAIGGTMARRVDFEARTGLALVAVATIGSS